MVIKGITDEDFTNYKEPSMFVIFPSCTFKCERESRVRCCQNSALAKAPDIEIPTCKLVERYLSNPITSAIVCGGLEPLDSLLDLITFMHCIRTKTDDDIVIFTGYKEEECEEFIQYIQSQGWKNIIIKFGRYIPKHNPHYDEVLGVKLASDNQYAIKIC